MSEWQPIYEEETDTLLAPADEELLLGWWVLWPERFWKEEVGFARVTGSHLHGRATHWMHKPPPPEEGNA